MCFVNSPASALPDIGQVTLEHDQIKRSLSKLERDLAQFQRELAQRTHQPRPAFRAFSGEGRTTGGSQPPANRQDTLQDRRARGELTEEDLGDLVRSGEEMTEAEADALAQFTSEMLYATEEITMAEVEAMEKERAAKAAQARLNRFQ